MSRNVLYAIIAILIVFAVFLFLANNRNRDAGNAVISPVPSPSVEVTEVPAEAEPTEEVEPTAAVSPTVGTTASPTP